MNGLSKLEASVVLFAYIVIMAYAIFAIDQLIRIFRRKK